MSQSGVPMEIVEHNVQLLEAFYQTKSEPRTLHRYRGILGFKEQVEAILRGQPTRPTLLAHSLGVVQKPFNEYNADLVLDFLDMRAFIMQREYGKFPSHNTQALWLRVVLTFLHFCGVPIKLRDILSRRPQYPHRFVEVYGVSYTEEEVHSIIAHLPSPEFKFVAEMCFRRGLRPSEAIGVRFGDIKVLPDGTYVAEIKHRPGDYGAKGKYSERVVPLTNDAVRYLEQVKQELQRIHGGLPPEEQLANMRVFPYSYETYRVTFEKAVVEAGVVKEHPTTPHTGRHYTAVSMLAAGVNPPAVKDLLKVSTSTFERYIRVTGREVIKACEFYDTLRLELLKKQRERSAHGSTSA